MALLKAAVQKRLSSLSWLLCGNIPNVDNACTTQGPLSVMHYEWPNVVVKMVSASVNFVFGFQTFAVVISARRYEAFKTLSHLQVRFRIMSGTLPV